MSRSTGASIASGGSKNWAPLLEQAAREVFELMLGSKLTATTASRPDSPEITSMVGLAGQMCGLMSIRCSTKAAAVMASKMLGLELDQVKDEVFDAFGEVGNMVAGNFKNKVPGLGDGCMLSVPTVVTGSDYCVRSQAALPAILLHLLFEDMPVTITLQVSE